MIVADSSAVLSLVAPDEDSTRAMETSILSNSLMVPTHWAVEVANALWMMKRRRRITVQELEKIVAGLSEIVVEQDNQPPDFWTKKVIPLADKYKLTVYDAAYLELAERRRLPLATLDKALRKAAHNASVELV